MRLASGPSFSPSRETLLFSITRKARKLILAALFSAQMAGAQNPNQLSQSSRLPSNTHPDALSTALDGTVFDHHGTAPSDKFLLHAVLGTDFSTGALLPNGEKVSDGPIYSAEGDFYASKGPWSLHGSIHEIIPAKNDDSLQLEQVLSGTVQYDGELLNAAFGIRQFTHSSRHPHTELENDGHGHISAHTVSKEIREKYTALMAQFGVDVTKNMTMMAGFEYDLGINKDLGTDETHLGYVGLDYHGEINKKTHFALRFLLAYSFANQHDPDAFFARYGFHLDRELCRHLYLTFSADGVAGKHRDSELFFGVGLKYKR